MPLKVLIVDDTRTIRYMLKKMLMRLNYRVVEAIDGEDALLKIQSEKPHMVLMDIQMPNMDGIECCRRIKENPLTRDTKVVMVTTKGEIKKINQAFKAHCDDYINKPVKEDELARTLEDLSELVSAKIAVTQTFKGM